MIKFVSGLRQAVFFPGTPDSSTNKTDRRNITEISLKRELRKLDCIGPAHLVRAVFRHKTMLLSATCN